jgi:Skp family chaperone for outer membrane proteins
MPMNRINTVRFAAAAFVFAFAVLIFTMPGCKKQREEIATILFKQTHNNIYKDITDTGYTKTFKQVFNKRQSQLQHADLILAYYKAHNYKPVFVLNHLFNNDIEQATMG